jgi:hypothetical protein
MYGYEEQVEPFRVTPGFLIFVTVLLLPAVAAVAIFLGAALVAGEVYAADAATRPVAQSATAHRVGEDVEGWKRTLVGICPVH